MNSILKRIHTREHEMHDVMDERTCSNHCIASCICDDGVIVSLIDVEAIYDDPGMDSQFFHIVASKDGKLLTSVRTDQKKDADRAFRLMSGMYTL